MVKVANTRRLASPIAAMALAGAGLVAFAGEKPLGPAPRIEFSVQLMSQESLLEFLQGNFTIIKNVASLPKPVMNAFTEIGGPRPVMANPGKKFEATDFITDETLPRQRLLFAGVNGNRCFVHHERGGRGHSYLLAFFSIEQDGMKPVWKGNCGPAKNLQALRAEIQIGHCGNYAGLQIPRRAD